MKVIKHGREYGKKCTCESCGCQFKYLLKDVKSGWQSSKYVECPECGAECTTSDPLGDF